MLLKGRGEIAIEPPRFKTGDWITVPERAPRAEFCRSPKLLSRAFSTSISGTLVLVGYSGGGITNWLGYDSECEKPHVVKILDVKHGETAQPPVIHQYEIRTHRGAIARLSLHETAVLEDMGRIASEDEIARAVLNKATEDADKER